MNISRQSSKSRLLFCFGVIMTETLLQGDCLELLPTIQDNSIDMILADLPYGMTANKWDSVIPLKPLFE